MPLITCPYCANAVTLPDPWTAPGFTCPHCRNTSAIAAPVAQPAAAPLPAAPIWTTPAAPLSLDEPQEFTPSRSPRTRRAPAREFDANEEAKGKRMIILGYAAFVAVPLIIVIAIAANKYGGSNDKADNSGTAQSPPVDNGKTPDPTPKKVTPRPIIKRDKNDKQPDESGTTPIDSGKKDNTDPTTPKELDTSVAIAPEPRTASGAMEVAVVPIPKIEIGIAPEPRATRPVMEAPPGFVSEWEKIGDVEVRIAGVAITRVPITNADLKDVDSPVEVLAVWIEVRTQSKSRTVELRRWQDPLGQYCELTTARGTVLDRGLLGPGATLRTGLPYKQPIAPDGPPRMDILVFAAPVEGAGNLRLILEAERVSESGKYRLTIPASAWKK